MHPTTSRNMQASGSAALIPYTLYRDSGLGDEFVVDQAFPVTFSNPQAITLPVYGKVILTGDKPPDTYLDTVTMTLSW